MENCDGKIIIKTKLPQPLNFYLSSSKDSSYFVVIMRIVYFYRQPSNTGNWCFFQVNNVIFTIFLLMDGNKLIHSYSKSKNNTTCRLEEFALFASLLNMVFVGSYPSVFCASSLGKTMCRSYLKQDISTISVFLLSVKQKNS